VDPKKRELELRILAGRINDLGEEARPIAGLENVTRRLFGVKGRVLEIAELLRKFARTGPDNEIDD
jgi:hypothetical protein